MKDEINEPFQHVAVLLTGIIVLLGCPVECVRTGSVIQANPQCACVAAALNWRFAPL
jgi:hypothetical protein